MHGGKGGEASVCTVAGPVSTLSGLVGRHMPDQQPLMTLWQMRSRCRSGSAAGAARTAASCRAMAPIMYDGLLARELACSAGARCCSACLGERLCLLSGAAPSWDACAPGWVSQQCAVRYFAYCCSAGYTKLVALLALAAQNSQRTPANAAAASFPACAVSLPTVAAL